MSAKECDHHGKSRRRFFWSACGTILTLIVIVLLAIFIIWLVLQPKKPEFTLQNATIFVFNQSSPLLLTSTFQVTLVSHNPNSRIGIYYDRLRIFATYRNQQITVSSAIQPIYQGHKETTIWSPFLFGTNVSISPMNALALPDDQSKGSVWITVKGDGKMRFKVGTFVTSGYHLFVQCKTYIQFGNDSFGIKLISMGVCKVNY